LKAKTQSIVGHIIKLRWEEDSHNFPKLDQYFYLMFGWLTAWQNMHNMLRVTRSRMSETPNFLASEAQMYN